MRCTALRARLALCLLLLSISALVPCRATAAQLRIDWIAPPGCPSRSHVLARVEELTDGAIQASSAVAIEVTRVAQTYRAHVVVHGSSGVVGERSLENPRCEVLVEGVALLLALSLSNRAAPPPERSPSLGAGLDGRFLLGPLPLPAAGVGGAISVDDLLSLHVELHGALFAPQSTTFDRMGTLGADFRLLSFGACVCHLWRLPGLSLGPCLGAEIHYVTASGVGGMPSLSGSTTWWAPSLRLLGRARIVKALGIRLVVEGALPMSRPRFVFPDVGELHRVSRVALQVLLGPEVRF